MCLISVHEIIQMTDGRGKFPGSKMAELYSYRQNQGKAPALHATHVARGGRLMGNAIGIGDNRLKHILQVARLSAILASELFGWSEEKCKEMFLLGYLHDIGYEYAEHADSHPEVAAQILRDAGYKYWQEVKWHGIPNPPYESDELLVLNLADMMTDGSGRPVTLRERLLDIEERHGSKSSQLLNSRIVSQALSDTLKSRSLTSETLESQWWPGE